MNVLRKASVRHNTAWLFSPAKLGLLLLVAVGLTPALAQTQQTREQQIQALLDQYPAHLRYEPKSDKFFLLGDSQQTWDNAQTRAMTFHSLNGVLGQLATIRSDAENAIVLELLQAQGVGKVWLGGSDISREGYWQWNRQGVPTDAFWSGGRTYFYQKFMHGEPNNSNNEDALEMIVDQGGWNDAPRNFVREYVVEFLATAVVGPKTLPQMPANARQAAIDQILADNPDVVYVPESDKFLKPVVGSFTWPKAEHDARNPDINNINGVPGQLVTIRSAATDAAAYAIATAKQKDVWIGASDKNGNGTWQWYEDGMSADTFFIGGTTGSAVEGAYENFPHGSEPNNNGGVEHFAEIRRGYNGGWNDLRYDNKRSYIVEWTGDELVGPLLEAPPALDTIPVPEPSNLSKFIKSKEKAIALGKAFFWDMQVGSDGRTACATCHFGAGIDLRTVNVVNPGAPGSEFGPQRDGQQELLDAAIAAFEGPNEAFDAAEFPHTKTAHPTNSIKSDNQVIEDTSEVYGSAGVVTRDFVRIVENNPVDEGNLVFDPIFNIAGANARQVTARNSPTVINAVFFDRLFWDGRANNVFNGVNEFGRTDGSVRVYKRNADGTLKRVRIALENSALASQAVGPPLSSVEMSWHGRNFKELGRKMLSLKALGLQNVHPEDSVLGRYATSRRGLRIKYSSLIKQAFKKNWWGATEFTEDGYTHMEANFSLYFGLALQMYQATLVSDQAPYDAWANGDENALTDAQKRGLKIFLNEGKCINCHGGAEFAGATVSDIRSMQPDHVTGEESLSLVEFMDMQQGPTAFYDGGFYNIGVRPTLEDLGVGARGPFGPLSYTRQRRDENRDIGQDVTVNSGDRVAVDGAFKTPTLRNIELTGPYFHNGGVRKLREAVQFYVRGANFFHENIDDLDPDVDGISELQDDPAKIGDVVQFLKSLTDDRVRFQRAPFDHPELRVPNGHKDEAENGVLVDRLMTIPAVGKNGGDEVLSFEERVQ